MRAATREDAPLVAEVFAALESDLFARPSWICANDVLGWWQRTDLANDTWLLFEDETLVAACGGDFHGEVAVYSGVVRPECRGRGLGAQLVELAEARFGGDGVVRLHTWAFAPDEGARELFTRRGYREVRRFWEMAIELDGPPPAPAVEVQRFREEDARAFHAAMGEAFAEHWEHHPMPFEEWWEQKRSAPDFDPSVWFVVRDGAEIAAIVRNDPDRNGGGYVGALGVRPAWRGRGFARALLLHTFGEFHRRGVTRVTLGVDAENATGATKLYESVGMRAVSEEVVYERSLA
jgi:mycothiol synthase